MVGSEAPEPTLKVHKGCGEDDVNVAGLNPVFVRDQNQLGEKLLVLKVAYVFEAGEYDAGLFDEIPDPDDALVV